CQQYNNSPYSC
nr:immunoglobulin light chain junction region [Macaca mulatta]